MRMRGREGALLLLSLVMLAGCGVRLPERDSRGNAWSEEWTMVGTGLGVEETGELTPLENKDILAADGLYYATWTQGEKRDYVNEDGEEADLYPCQLYVLVAECQSEEEAVEHRDNWLSGARETYQVEGEEERSVAGMDYTLLTYQCSDTSPFDRGISAFGCYEERAFCMEMTVLSDFQGDEEEKLQSFLLGCHFAEK